MAQESSKTTIGSLYFNLPKDADRDLGEALHKVFTWLQEKNVYMGISLNRGRLDGLSENKDGYLSVVGFPNSFKKTKDSKSSHFYLVPKGDNRTGSDSASTVKPMEMKREKVANPLPF